MKTLRTLFTIAFVVIAGSFFAQMQQKIEIKLNEIGDVDLTLSMTMNASEWQTWLANAGNNPALIKRDAEQNMPGFFLDDFELEKDEMNRSFTLKLKAYGMCKIDKRGRWIIETDQKKAQITELTDHKYMLVSSPPELGGNVQQTYIIEFPDQAQDIKIETDTFGQSIFEFKMQDANSETNMAQISGITLLLAGLALGGVKLFKN